VQNTSASLLEGRMAGTVIESTRRVPLLIRGPADLQRDPDAFAALRITTAGRSQPALVQRRHRSSAWTARSRSTARTPSATR
jgi:cobalt-zinc-cadmium resistance protein CzcA